MDLIALFVVAALVLLAFPELLLLFGGTSTTEDPVRAQKQQDKDRRLLRLCGLGVLLVVLALVVNWMIG